MKLDIVDKSKILRKSSLFNTQSKVHSVKKQEIYSHRKILLEINSLVNSFFGKNVTFTLDSALTQIINKIRLCWTQSIIK